MFFRQIFGAAMLAPYFLQICRAVPLLSLLLSPPLPAAVLDDFNAGTLSSHWHADNYPQYGSLGDGIAFDLSTSPGLLAVVYDNVQGSDQTTFMLRDDARLDQVGDYAQVEVRIQSGPTDVNVGPGLCLATQYTGIDQDRSNTVRLALRNDAIARANAYGAAGVEIADPYQIIAGYQPGNWVRLRVVRSQQNQITLQYALGAGPLVTIGHADFSAHVVPVVPGLMLGNGLADFTAQFENFTIGNVNAEPTPTPTPDGSREISLVLPANLQDLPRASSTRHQVNFPTGQGDNTYHHNALITGWKNRFYVAWTTTPASECTLPYEALISHSNDAETWSSPVGVTSPAGDAAYEAYMRDRFDIPAGTTVTINMAPRNLHPTPDKLYLWCLAWLTRGDGSRDYVGRVFETVDGEAWSEIPPRTLHEYEFQQALGSVRITGSNHGFFKLRDGRLLAFNLAPGAPRFPITSDPTGLTQWLGGMIAPGACGDVGEPGGYEGPDGVLHATVRCGTGHVWHAYSEDAGQTWTELRRQDLFTDNPGNKDWGRFPDGSIWYVGGPRPGSRQELVLGISHDGWRFDNNYLIRWESIAPIWYSLCKSEDRPGWEYPSGFYQDQKLYVAYSRTRDFIEVSKIDLNGIIPPQTAVVGWNEYAGVRARDAGR